ncbi:Gfo/Idh/MocA family oxidoreductase [Pseudokineococcus marinus]|uniref:Glycosyl hydrolase family 109 protein n=1 Tax=Pseudokineococcus marinus TaxID=351215 RepID=A0A849BMG6_9ACTN|nr:Gfo/Idh/MocA family oxidoreductase [Pseudokineococcus marinus]
MPPMTRWGFLATGGIATTVAGDLPLVPGAEALAVASRDAGRAAAFAERHGFARSYGSYADLLADPDVDVVYVATPHGQHRAVARAALEAGKHVLVEKAFTTTLAGAHELVDLARDRGLFAMEAMWTRFQPTVVALLDALADGVVGEVRHVHADLGFPVPEDPAGRFFDPVLGGGALLDMGVYPVSVVRMVMGAAPSEVVARGSLTSTGVDAESSLLLAHADGRTATTLSTILARPARHGTITGTGGRVETEGAVHAPDAFVVHRPDEEPVRTALPRTGRGYAHMLEHVQDCLDEGRTESPLWPLSTTLEVMGVLEEALQQLGVRMDDDRPV